MTNLDELEKLAKAATPGPFSIERRDDNCGGITYIVHGGKDYAWCKDDLDRKAKFNAAFVAAANSAAILELIARVRDAEREIEELTGLAERVAQETVDAKRERDEASASIYAAQAERNQAKNERDAALKLVESLAMQVGYLTSKLEHIAKKRPHDVSREEAADMACEFVLVARKALAGKGE
jgi:hypothetical protein